MSRFGTVRRLRDSIVGPPKSRGDLDHEFEVLRMELTKYERVLSAIHSTADKMEAEFVGLTGMHTELIEALKRELRPRHPGKERIDKVLAAIAKLDERSGRFKLDNIREKVASMQEAHAALVLRVEQRDAARSEKMHYQAKLQKIKHSGEINAAKLERNKIKAAEARRKFENLDVSVREELGEFMRSRVDSTSVLLREYMTTIREICASIQTHFESVSEYGPVVDASELYPIVFAFPPVLDESNL